LSGRGSSSPSPCCVKSPHPDHSIPTVARNGCNAQSRVVHRAPPPFPGTNTVNRPYEADHQHTPSTDGNPPTAQASGTPSTGVPRPMVIDALLRLLVYHWTGQELVQSNGSVEPQRATLDRLYRALCATSTGRMNLPSDWVGNDVPPLARRLLPHLIRIAYTELVSNEDPWDESQGTANETETIHSELNADVHSEFIDHFTSCAILRLVPVYQTDSSLCERDVGIVHLLATIHAYSTTQTGRMERLRVAQTLTIATTNTATPAMGNLSISNPTLRTLVLVEPSPRCPVAEVAALVRLSFHPEHRAAICELGKFIVNDKHCGVHALIALLRCEQTFWSDPALQSFRSNQNDYANPTGVVYRSVPTNATVPSSVFQTGGSNVSVSSNAGTRPGAEHLLETSLALRRYICMALTNLTYGVAANKALLCRRLANLEALLAQMEIGNEEFLSIFVTGPLWLSPQVSASVLRNLSWRTDTRSKVALRRVNAPRRLTLAAMTSHRDSTLRTTLSALWNLSAHCAHNKRAVCSVDGVFSFLLRTMHCDDLNNRLVIVENSGGILRNISAVAAAREEYRILLNKSNCYPILVELLRHSPSLTVVVNVCGTLWNLTAPSTCPAEDLLALCRLGVIDLLHMLARSPHELIRNSSTAVLRNLMHPNQASNPGLMTTVSQTTSSANTNPTVDPNVHSDLNGMATSAKNATTQDTTLDGSTVSDSNVNQTVELLYRRRVSARSRLPFGLLSVVLEADDDDEENAEQESDEEDTEDQGDDNDGENTEEDDLVTPICAHEQRDSADRSQEALAIDDPASLILHPNADTNPGSFTGTELEPSDCWAQLDPGSEDEQIRVYAEEGTPFPPDSTTASCLELNESSSIPSARMGPAAMDQRVSKIVHSFSVLGSYQSSDMLPRVYAMEDSPLQLTGDLSPCLPVASGDELDSANTIQEPLNSDDGSCLPSPPPDVSHLIPPLNQLHVGDEDADEFEGTSHGEFDLPPPPLPAQPHTATTETDIDAEQEFLPTPLIFSRGTSSYLSSGPLGTSPRDDVFQSSPQSECSDPSERANNTKLSMITDLELETSAGSKCIVSPVDSVIGESTTASCFPKRKTSEVEFDVSNGDILLHAHEDEDEEEVRLPFAEEGTPQDAVSFVEDPALNETGGCNSFEWHSIQEPSCGGDSRVDEDDDESKQAQILQQCIASAMPGNLPYPTLRSEFPNTASASTAFAPDLARTVAFVEEGDNDSVRNFAVEDTPFGTSTKASSLCDLIMSEQKSSIGQNHHRHSPDHLIDAAQHSVDRGSSSSSINGETSSDLLSEVIQSAMPKSVPTKMCDSRILSASRIQNTSSCTTTKAMVSTMTPTATTTTTTAAVVQDTDCLQLYAVEGTPGAEDLSGFSSVHDVCESIGRSFTSQSSSSMHGPPATSLAVPSGFCSTVSFEGVPGSIPVPPTPPRRTSSVLTSPRDPFSQNPAPNRPQATVAPMPQVARCAPITRSSNFEQRNSEAEFPDVEKTTTVTTSNTTNSGLLANVNDKDDASSFSSLLSIESVGLEHSLLQECISSAMPRPKVCGVLRKPQQMWSQLRGDFVVDDSLPEQDESHLSAALAPQPNGKEKESAAAVNTTAIKLGNKETALSAPVTQRASTLGSSDDSSLCSSTRPNSGPDYETHADEINSHCRVSNDDNQANKSRNTALHFLYCGSDGAHPRLPCSSNLATKSWTSPRLPPSVHQSHNHGVDVKGTVSASSEVNLSSGANGMRKPSHLLPPAIRPTSHLPVLGSRIPSCGAVSGSRSSGQAPRGSGVGIGSRQSQANKRTSNRSEEILEGSSVVTSPASVTDLLAEGAETILAELRDITAATNTVSAPNSANGLRSEVTSSDSCNSLELLQDTDSLLSVLDSLPESDKHNPPPRSSARTNSGGQLPSPSVKQHQLTPASQLTPNKSRLVQPSRLSRPGTVSDHPRSPRSGSATTSASSNNTLNQLSKPLNTPRRTKPVSASPLVDRVSRVSTSTTGVKATSRPSGLRAPSTVGETRTAMTCPPSASGRSLASSRSGSTTGSVSNLAVTSRGAAVHAVSAQSVCAALHKRERTVAIAKPIIRPQSASQTKSVAAQSLAPTHKSKAAISCGIALTESSESIKGSDKITEVPKPIRGGRKSLTGRKPDSHQIPNSVQGKPVCKPKPVGNHTNSIRSSSTSLLRSASPASVPQNNSTIGGSVSLNTTDSTPKGTVSNTNQDCLNGMWIVRGELGLVNGFK
ncbi:Adenomatous polyposis coli protein, partial [Fasciolopsis buskii]